MYLLRGYNKVLLMGNLRKDPELFTIKKTQTLGVRLCIVSVVRYRLTDGEGMGEETLNIDAILYGKQAERVASDFKKGHGVFVDGRLRERVWEYENKSFRKLEIVISDLRPLSGSVILAENIKGEDAEDDGIHDTA